jgi:hypothetical protein
MTDTLPTTVPEFDAPPRKARPVAPWRIAALVVAVLLLAGAGAVAILGDNDRDDASHDQRRAEAQVQSQRVDTRRARAQLASEHQRLDAASRAISDVLATDHNIADLVARGAAAHQAVQNAGISGNVDEYNTAVERANAIVDQYDAAIERLDKQVAALSSGGTAQLARASGTS